MASSMYEERRKLHQVGAYRKDKEGKPKFIAAGFGFLRNRKKYKSIAEKITDMKRRMQLPEGKGTHRSSGSNKALEHMLQDLKSEVK